MNFSTSTIAMGLTISAISCASYNPKSDLKSRIDQRIKTYPYAKVIEIKKYVEELTAGGIREVSFAVTYEVTKDCYANQQSMYGITLSDCVQKRPGGLEAYSAHLVKKGSKIYEVATLDYNIDTKKLSEIEFSARNQSKNVEFEK